MIDCRRVEPASDRVRAAGFDCRLAGLASDREPVACSDCRRVEPASDRMRAAGFDCRLAGPASDRERAACSDCRLAEPASDREQVTCLGCQIIGMALIPPLPSVLAMILERMLARQWTAQQPALV
jgi:hypothetical protein